MQLLIAKWGNSLAVRLPSQVTKQLQIQAGDQLNLSLNPEGNITLTPARVFDKAAFLKVLQAQQKKQPATTPVLQTLRDQARY